MGITPGHTNPVPPHGPHGLRSHAASPAGAAGTAHPQGRVAVPPCQNPHAGRRRITALTHH